MKLLGPLLLAALLLSGCEAKLDPEVYPLTPTDAIARLQKADIAGFQQAETCGLPIAITPAPAPNGIRWRVANGLAEVASFTVRLAPEGDAATRSVIELPADLQGGEIYSGAQHYDHPALQQPLRPALAELVNSAMEQRPFDSTRIPTPQSSDDACAQQRAQMNASAGVRARAFQANPQSPTASMGYSAPAGAASFGQPNADASAPNNPTPGIVPDSGVNQGTGGMAQGPSNPAEGGH
jgi:hypothetical protein